MKNKKHQLIFSLMISLVLFSFANADLTSPSFDLENPVNIIEGGASSSSSFQYISNTGQVTSGQSTSGSFAHNVGELYFPIATTPVVSATPGSTQVTLSWTSSNGTFANINSYSVGVATTTGGPYTFTSVGNVLTSIKTGLTNGTPYFFKIRSYASGLLLSESVEVSATPTGTTPPPPPPPSSPGGGSIPNVVQTGVSFSGRAYPLSKVSILKDGQLALSTIAGPDSNFTANLTNLSAGDYTFSVYGEDKDGVRSGSFTFPISVTAGATTNIGGIFIAPTISVDKSEVKKGDNIAIFGQSANASKVVISVNSQQEYFENADSDANGVYLENFDTSVLEMGQHTAKSKVQKGGEISSFGDAIGFIVGTKNVLADNKKKFSKCDLNEDGRCNLIDFSIAAFWYKKQLTPAFLDKEKKYLNGDGKIDLIDFSIMAFYWTG